MALEKDTIATEYLNKALKLAGDEKENKDIAMVYNVFGELYYLNSDYKKSLYYYYKALGMNIQNYNYLKISALEGIAKAQKATGRYQKGIEIGLKADSLAKAEKSLIQQIDICQTLNELYDSIGQADRAYKYFRRYSELKDSAFNIEKTKQLEFLNIKFETTQKQL